MDNLPCNSPRTLLTLLAIIVDGLSLALSDWWFALCECPFDNLKFPVVEVIDEPAEVQPKKRKKANGKDVVPAVNDSE